MARHIDADKLIWQVQNNDKYGTITKQVFISLLQNSEMEDVAPVVHAHWINGEECSECGGLALMEYDGKARIIQSEYCPHCGAKMDEEVPDNA